MIITVTGSAGSGKSTVAKLLAQKLKYRHFSAGDLRRQIASERGMTIEEFNKLGETNPDTDRLADERLAELGKQDGIVVDGRLGWRFIPRSFKVFLRIDEKVAAERILKDHLAGKRRSERKLKTVNDVLDEIAERTRSDVARYKKWYHLDYRDPKHYDLVIDTTNLTPEQIVDRILIAAKKRSQD
ncbi:nucleoside monophosphate kinase [Candidatus Woesearchaeota archaeon]|nr:nucleoside monophosphate kinase [Candidatus Woesearchaeota archaeon]